MPAIRVPHRCLAIAIALSGCYTGLGAAAGGGDDEGADSAAAEGGGASDSEGGAAGEARPDPAILDMHTAVGLRRLTRFEYGNTVRDLLGVEDAEADLPEDAKVDFLSNNAHAKQLGLAELETFARVAEDVATAAMTTIELPGCTADAPSTACLDAWLPTFLLRAFRRPPTEDDVARYRGLFDARVAAGDPPGEALRLVIQAVLLSPHFLYRDELAPDGSIAPGELDGYAVASRLSYLLWATMPDDTLLQAAADGELDTAAGVESHARRMLDDPRASAPLSIFVDEWLYILDSNQLSKSAALYPAFTPEIRALLDEERDAFTRDAVGAGDLVALLSGSHSYMNAALAAYYGVSGPTGDAFERVELDPDRSAGLLTQGAFLAANAKANQTSPVSRGNFVLARLVCQSVPPPPPGVPPLPDPDALPDLTTRERLEMFHLEGSCATCHKTMDELGFLFEHYDADGRWRDDEAGKPVDSAVELAGIPGLEGSYAGAPEFVRALVDSDALRSCVSRQWFRFGTGRIESVDDTDTLTALQDAFAASPDDAKEMIVALTQTDAFRYRTDDGGQP